jgi:hypothetical protein
MDRQARLALLGGDAVEWQLGALIPRLAVKRSAADFWSRTTPLLEEERNVGIYALIANLANPIDVNWPVARSTLTSDDHPVDAIKV